MRWASPPKRRRAESESDEDLAFEQNYGIARRHFLESGAWTRPKCTSPYQARHIVFLLDRQADDLLSFLTWGGAARSNEGDCCWAAGGLSSDPSIARRRDKMRGPRNRPPIARWDDPAPHETAVVMRKVVQLGGSWAGSFLLAAGAAVAWILFDGSGTGSIAMGSAVIRQRKPAVSPSRIACGGSRSIERSIEKRALEDRRR